MAIERKMPRVQEVALPIIREALPGVAVYSWIPDVDYREYPFLQVRRLGGLPLEGHIDELDKPVIELSAYSRDGLVETENLYLDARWALFDAVRTQKLTDAGYLHSFFDTLGPTQFDSPFDDSWRIQGLIQLGLRPRR